MNTSLSPAAILPLGMIQPILVSIDTKKGVMFLVAPERIAAVMALSSTPMSLPELDAMVAKGLRKTALKASVARIYLGTADRKLLLYKIIPEATYKRRRDRLSPRESERTERLARVVAAAEYVWNSEEHSRIFLTSPHPLLQGQAPVDVAMTELGARRVEELLSQLFFGIAT